MQIRLSRTANFLVAVALGFVGWFWYAVGLAMWIGNGLGKDSGPSAFFDASFIAFLIFWTVVSFVIVWGVLRFLKRALKPPPRNSTNLATHPVQPPVEKEHASPDEILSRLVKKS